MSKRHNRKRTRSRPRHRDSGHARSTHIRTYSIDTEASYASMASNPTFLPPPTYYPPGSRPQDHWNHWDRMYAAWQTRNQLHRQQEQQALDEAQRLRFFGGEAGDELSLLEPMLRVVTGLFDGETDYVDP
ncbi:uncharacterized protein EI97DRAFT_443922 [Westerdykella ornata]|uniref:Uncharacterized protein n=1 Tax=Westerdykella ornata TaxID=318751 RepID=A0A6A6JEQ4_WESOR|nr:uncharacterized protein EI97DRAFT_443922 [Westerdykella ornata]KAF2274755.1 hypothetical protein EI97DRAFT_443922 [Westerdykella ornata]